MPFWLLIVVTAIYALVAADFMRSGQTALGIMYFGYAFANVGAILLVDK